MFAGKFVIYITDSKNRCLALPVNPTELLLKGETDDKSNMIIGSGEYNRVGDFKLRTMTIESILPTSDAKYLDHKFLHFKEPENYLDFLSVIYTGKQATRVIIPSLNSFSHEMTITKFEYGFKNSYAEEYAYTMELKQFKPLQIIKHDEFIYKPATEQQPDPAPPRPEPPQKIGMGSIVIVNGQLHRDSYGSGPGVYEQNARRKISNIALGKPFPYHVALESGGWRGWVRENEVTLA